MKGENVRKKCMKEGKKYNWRGGGGYVLLQDQGGKPGAYCLPGEYQQDSEQPPASGQTRTRPATQFYRDLYFSKTPQRV
jgi:hypothetical protein